MVSDSPRSRPTVVTLVLAGILVLMVAAAWALVRYYHTSAREGAIVLEEMRRQTLEKLWPPSAYQAHFEWRDASGHALSRLDVARQPVQDGFEGVLLHTVPASPGRQAAAVREAWTVSDDLSKANYVADYLSQNVRMGIRLDGGEIRFQSTTMKEPAAMEAPANYIPEGLEWLAIRTAARIGKKAAFMWVSNEASHAARDVRTGRLIVTPAGPRSVRCVREWSGGSDTETYELDEAGEVIGAKRDDGSVMVPVPAGPELEPPSPESPEEPKMESEEEPGVLVKAGDGLGK
jgi:hypothetical protein